MKSRKELSTKKSSKMVRIITYLSIVTQNAMISILQPKDIEWHIGLKNKTQPLILPRRTACH
jgi:hypothetical protein